MIKKPLIRLKKKQIDATTPDDTAQHIENNTIGTPLNTANIPLTDISAPLNNTSSLNIDHENAGKKMGDVGSQLINMPISEPTTSELLNLNKQSDIKDVPTNHVCKIKIDTSCDIDIMSIDPTDDDDTYEKSSESPIKKKLSPITEVQTPLIVEPEPELKPDIKPHDNQEFSVDRPTVPKNIFIFTTNFLRKLEDITQVDLIGSLNYDYSIIMSTLIALIDETSQEYDYSHSDNVKNLIFLCLAAYHNDLVQSKRSSNSMHILINTVAELIELSSHKYSQIKYFPNWYYPTLKQKRDQFGLNRRAFKEFARI